MNCAPHAVQAACPYKRVHNLFVTVGLRHLVVTNNDASVAGMITRHDLVQDSHLIYYLFWEFDTCFVMVQAEEEFGKHSHSVGDGPEAEAAPQADARD